ncbi:dockerin type I repeat-containing protein [Ruminococcus sp.]|uniref:dockerin type I repeat-containing protein n=1 Tax=Ruminococcus sp. TaxID=41978 RepID=UPI002CA26BBB|nr:dockerin type I repeat-containing protein [Ruminococcus sp.]HNZ98586.1 dockerin type I repeat-containing protein [Ruminococcus sp.]
MKKTLRTVVTAAMFAAANMSAIPAAAGENEAVPDLRNDVEREAYSNFASVYGPSPTYPITTTTTDLEEFFTTTTTTGYPVPAYGTIAPRTTTTTIDHEDDPFYTTTTTSDLEEFFMTTTTAPQPVYGPPIQDWVGDVNLDGSVDSFDVLSVRKMLIKGTDQYGEEYKEAYYGDMNNDGKLTIADLLLLQKYVLGKVTKQELQDQFHYWYGSHNVEIEKIELPVPVTEPEDDPVATTTTTTYDPRQDIVVTLYGIAPVDGIKGDIRFDRNGSDTTETLPQDTTGQEK